MKFRVHLFREYRETFEVEAENVDAALNYVDENISDLVPETEMLDFLPHACIDPLLPDGSVDYDKSEWRE